MRKNKCFSLSRSAATPRAAPDQARAAYASWAFAQIPEPAELTEPQDEPGGSVEFHVIDTHGNLVRLGGFPPGAE